MSNGKTCRSVVIRGLKYPFVPRYYVGSAWAPCGNPGVELDCQASLDKSPGDAYDRSRN